MQLPVKLVSAATTVGKCLKANSPKILIGFGIVSSIAALVDAVKQTPIAIEHMEQHKEEIENIKKYKSEEHEDYTPAMYKKDIFGAYTRTVLDLGKDYSRSLVLEVVSIGCILGATKIFNDTNKLLASTLAATIDAAAADRRKVEEALGEEAAAKIFNGVTEQKLTEEVMDENGKTKKVHSKRNLVDPNSVSPYDFIWVEGDPFWDPIPEFRVNHIVQVENTFNKKIFGEKNDFGGYRIKPTKNAHVSLNDIRSYFKPASEVFTQIGQFAGYDDTNPDGCIRLRYKDISIPDPENPNFYKNAMLISPNIAGSMCPDYIV